LMWPEPTRYPKHGPHEAQARPAAALGWASFGHKSTLGRACHRAPLMWPEPTRYPKHGPHEAQARPAPAVAAVGVECLGFRS